MVRLFGPPWSLTADDGELAAMLPLGSVFLLREPFAGDDTALPIVRPSTS